MVTHRTFDAFISLLSGPNELGGYSGMTGGNRSQSPYSALHRPTVRSPGPSLTSLPCESSAQTRWVHFTGSVV